ncbi:MAG: hypothetical protein ACTSXL_02275 [Alphaproteobacteria bacterium]
MKICKISVEEGKVLAEFDGKKCHPSNILSKLDAEFNKDKLSISVQKETDVYSKNIKQRYTRKSFISFYKALEESILNKGTNVAKFSGKLKIHESLKTGRE